MKKNNINSELKFSTVKIKKIIQENKEIGKIANMTPFIISKSLEYLLKDILERASDLSIEDGIFKVFPQHIKKAINENPDWNFLNDLVKDIPDELPQKTRQKKSKSKKDKQKEKQNTKKEQNKEKNSIQDEENVEDDDEDDIEDKYINSSSESNDNL